ncbi:MAG TPA: hypothetical protein ENN03_10120 [bacterium]|nr:hypothetical protein [bacterium]
MKEKSPISVLFTLLILIGAAFLGFAFLASDIDSRWVIAIIFFLAGAAGLPLVHDKELLLLRAMAFTIPYAVGFLYRDQVASDIIWIFDLFLYALYAFWFIRTGGFRNVRFITGRVTDVALIMIMWSVLSVVIAVSQLSSGFGVVFEIKAFLVLFYLINNIKDKKKLMAVVECLILGLAIQAGLGVLQSVSGSTLGLEFLGERSQSLWWRGARVYGTFGFPNNYAAYMSLLIPLSISLFYYYRGWRKLLYSIITVMSFFSLGLSYSRSAWVGTAGSLIIMFLLIAKAKRMDPKTYRMALIVVIAAIVIGSIFWEMIMIRTEQETDYRMLQIEIALQIIRSNPIIGVGLYNYQYHSYDLFAFWQPVHNCYLRLATETGIPGMILFLWLYFLVMRESYRSLKFNDKLINAVGMGIFCGHAAFATIILFGPEYQHYRQKFLFWVLAGLAISLKRVRLTEIDKEKRLKEKRRIRALGDPSTRRSIVPAPPIEQMKPEEDFS